MGDLERLQKLYVNARNAAAGGNDVLTVCTNLTEISEYMKNLAKVSSYYDALKCEVKAGSIDNFIQYVKVCGLADKKVLTFFGLSKSTADAPSFGQIMSGDAIIEKPIVKDAEPKSENDMDDLIDNMVEETIEDKPVRKESEVVAGKSGEEEAPVISDGAGAEETQAEQKVEGGFTPQCLDDFIGQAHVVKRIKQEIAAAKKLGKRHIDNILLFGTRGLGKSTLMKLIAKELGVDFRFMDASAFSNDVGSQRKLHKFFMNICEYGQPVVIAFDEIHAMPKHIQTALLTLLNDRIYSYMDNNGMTQNIAIKEFTFIGATTDADKVLPTIKDRCNNLTFYLKDYTREELAKIFNIKFGSYGLSVEDGVMEDCINRCRSSIREVESFVNGLRTKAINADTTVITQAIAEEYFSERELDPIGLRTKDIEILNVLAHDAVGVMAAETLAAKVHLDANVYMSEFEPYLIKLGFINISNRGRGLSEKGKRYLTPEAYVTEPVAEEIVPVEIKEETADSVTESTDTEA